MSLSLRMTSRSVGRRAGVIQRLEGHAGGHRAVADDGHGAPRLAEAAGGDRHAEGRADRGAGVADAEGVVLAFRAGREGREAARLLDRVQAVAPPGQHLVRIGLVADVPDQPVVRRVEDIMQGDGQLDRAQAGGEMAAARADAYGSGTGAAPAPPRAISPQAAGADRRVTRSRRAADKRWARGSFGAVYTDARAALSVSLVAVLQQNLGDYFAGRRGAYPGIPRC